MAHGAGRTTAITAGEHGAHRGVVVLAGMQVDVGELLGHPVQQVGLGKSLDVGVEVEALEDVARRVREALDVGAEVLADVGLVAQQLAQAQPYSLCL